MRKICYILLFALGAMFFILEVASATKICPGSKCLNDDNVYDQKLCQTTADWVAIGKITKVRHKKEGYPLHKDFARFTFVIEQWVKGENGQKQIQFQVGWCQNQQELPKNTSGLFIFYGINDPVASTGEAQYIHFEKLK